MENEAILLGLAGLNAAEVQNLNQAGKQAVAKAVKNVARSASYTREQQAAIAQLPRAIKSADVAAEIGKGDREFSGKQYFVRKSLGNAPAGIAEVYLGNEQETAGVTNLEQGKIVHPFVLQNVEVNAAIAANTTVIAAVDYGKGIAGVAFQPLRNAVLLIRTADTLVAEIPLQNYDLTSSNQTMDTFRYAFRKPKVIDPADGKITMHIRFGAHAATAGAGNDVFVEILLDGEEIAPRK